MTFLADLGEGPRLGGRAARRKRRERTRRRMVAAVVVFLVALTTLVTVVLATGGGTKGARKGGVAERTQQTLLLQLRGAGGLAISSALLAHDPIAGGAVVLVEPQVIATVPGIGTMAFGKALRAGGPSGSRNALSDLVGVTVDGSWVLDVAAFTHLVDLEGGINATVDVPVLAGRDVLLQPGRQRLDGAQALAFATYLATGEPEQTRLARLRTVLDGVLTALPPVPTVIVGSLGAGSQTSLGSVGTAELLTGLQKDDKADQLQYDILPVVTVDAGTDEVRFRLETGGARALVDRVLAGSIPSGSRILGNRVLVLNGVGTAGLGEKVRSKLVPAGFTFVGSRNAEKFGYATSQVLVKDATPEGAALGARVAKALGLPDDSVRTTQIGAVADVIVLVGRDFRG